jgi:hypothetical protein
MNSHGIESRPAAIVGSYRAARRCWIRDGAERREAPDADSIAVLAFVVARRESNGHEIPDAGRPRRPAGLLRYPAD